VLTFAGFQPDNTMGRVVEKARVAFAAAENAGPAQAVQQLWEAPERALQLSVASEGAGCRKGRACACCMQRFGGSPEWISLSRRVTCGSSLADGAGDIGFTLGITVTAD